MSRTIRVAALAAALLMEGVAESSAALSASVQVDAAPQGKRWTTVFTNTVPLSWTWNPAAVTARLDINGMSGSLSTNFAAGISHYLWRVFETDAPTTEDVYDLTLTFFDGENAGVETNTARLAVVKGAFGSVAIDSVAGSPAWSKVRGNTVIPYDAAWSAEATNAVTARLVIAREAGATQTTDFASAAGYHGWKLKNSGWGYGTFNLSLTFPGTGGAFASTLLRPADGSSIRLR